jgi:hypothetical protein
LPFHSKHTLAVDFQGGQLTSDAGLLLLGRAEAKVGLIKAMAQAIRDPRDSSRIHHPLFDLLRQRIFQIACGYEDADDADDLRGDPIFKICCDRLPLQDPDLASQPTISRLENQATEEDLSRLREAFLETFIRSTPIPPVELTLDIDAWDDPTHGNQQLSLFNGHYDQFMLLPLQISEAGSGQILWISLFSGTSHPGTVCLEGVQWVVRRLRQAWPQVRITLRGDGAFPLPVNLEACEALPVDYVLGLAGNARLRRAGAALLEEARQYAMETGRKVRLFDELFYAAGSWERKRRVIIKAEWLAEGPNLRFLVTTRREDPQALYDRIYVQRGEDCENRIKELKRGLSSDRLSCHSARANQFRLLLFQAAYWLILELRRAARGTALARAQVTRLREQLLKTGALVKVTARRVWVHLASACPWKEVWFLIWQRLSVEGISSG